MNRYERKNPPSLKLRRGGRRGDPPSSRATGLRRGEGSRMIACGKINKHGRETRIAFEFMGDLTKSAVRRVFSSTARAEEIANA